MAAHVDFLLIGGGLAAATAAETLRLEEAKGSILLLASENVAPYQRPPLSKEFLFGTLDSDKLMVLNPEFYREQEIKLSLGTCAIALDAKARRIRTDRSDDVAFGKLLIATGATPRRLIAPGADLPGIFYLRSLPDARALKSAAQTGKRAVVIGGSFIGLELASSLTKIGLRVTLLERHGRLFHHLNAPTLSAFFARTCEDHGVELLVGDTVMAFQGQDRVVAVATESGRSVPCDFVVLGIGVTPNTNFLTASDIAVENGIVVDRYLQTNHPDIFAAGDVAFFDDPVFGKRRRVEHWDNAIKQGRLAAKNMLGQRVAYDEVSYFFSDLFDFSFEFIGSVDDIDERVERGSLENGSYALFYLKDGVPRAVFSTGRPAGETRAMQTLIRYRVNVEAVKQRLADIAFPLERIPNQTVLILQGGGALGAFECGVVRAMEEAKIFPDVVAGVSIGALNGAIVASNPRYATAALEAFWQTLMVETPGPLVGGLAEAASLWQILTCGVPHFFQPRWLTPSLLQGNWTSFYDTAPVKDLLTKYVDFSRLNVSPVRLMVSAVNVETGQLEVFDSYVDDLTPDHIVASGSLPPGFPWTTINGKHYWDGGIISNSPLEQVVDRCGASGKQVFIVDLFSTKRALPTNLMEVQARRDEIVYGERIRNDVRTREVVHDFRKLVDEIVGSMSAAEAARIRERPHYIQLMGDVSPIKITRIIRQGEAGELCSRDYDFSRQAIERNKLDGYELASRILKAHSGSIGTSDDTGFPPA